VPCTHSRVHHPSTGPPSRSTRFPRATSADATGSRGRARRAVVEAVTSDRVMMRRGVRAMGEGRHRELPQEWGYRRLEAAVIVSAVRDLEKPGRDARPGGWKRPRRRS
jgi:hypothetical protein